MSGVMIIKSTNIVDLSDFLPGKADFLGDW
jgi:hypothetical protein